MKLTRRHASLLLAAPFVLGLSACETDPHPETVARELIESFDLPADKRQCLLDKLDTYSDDDLEKIGKANDTINFDNPAWRDAAGADLEKFISDLESCDATIAG